MQSWRQAPGYGCRNGSGDGSPTHLNKRRMKKLGIITLLCILATDCEAQIMGGSHWDCSHWDRHLGMYIGVVAVPSALNVNGILPGDHAYRWYEVDASRRAAHYFDKKYGRGSKNYDSNKPEDFFDINTFVKGGYSSYTNPRKGTNYQGGGNPISGGKVSLGEILTSLYFF